MPKYVIAYECPQCGHLWTEIWFSPCDSECPDCGLSDIEAVDYEVVPSSEEDEQQ